MESSARKWLSSENRIKIFGIIVVIIILMAGIVYVIRCWQVKAVEPTTRIAVIDTGMTLDCIYQTRIIAERSFVNTINGYEENISSTFDRADVEQWHGTYVANIILENSPHVVLINAKVFGNEDGATDKGIIEAIYWAVLGEDADVINLSLGGVYQYNASITKAVEWAFSRGVFIVSSAGNEGSNSPSIKTPANSPFCITVGGLTPYDTPEDYSSMGPTVDRHLKPDISALGRLNPTEYRPRGTSFAAPRISAVASEIISSCTELELTWTPGMLKSILLSSAEALPYPKTQVGAGKVSLENALELLHTLPLEDNIPQIAFCALNESPLEIDVLFVNQTYVFGISLFCSDNTEFEFAVSGRDAEQVKITSSCWINQTGVVDFEIKTTNETLPFLADIIISSLQYEDFQVKIDFIPRLSVARIAVDTFHTNQQDDRIYGDYFGIYWLMTQMNISVVELDSVDDFSLSYLSAFDSIVLMNPCSWDWNYSDSVSPVLYSGSFSESEVTAFEQYILKGGGFLIAGNSNQTIDVAKANDFINWTGFAFDYNNHQFFDTDFTTLGRAVHPIMHNVTGFIGSSNTVIHGIEAVPLIFAKSDNNTILNTYFAYKEMGLGRIFVAGCNDFLSKNSYEMIFIEDSFKILTQNILLWLLRLL